MKILKYIAIALIGVSAIFLSCESDKKSAGDLAQVYRCPMKCEGEKTYNEMGSCPVCEMDLTLVNNNSKTVSEEGISEESVFPI